MINQTEEWLYKKAKEVDSELELQDLYTSKFMFGGSWVMDLLEEYHKEQLILSSVSERLFKESEVKEICRNLARICTTSKLIVGINDRFEEWWNVNFNAL